MHRNTITVFGQHQNLDEHRILYIAPYGNDQNSGTIDAPFGTLYAAMNSMEPGDVLLVRGGIYNKAGAGVGVYNKNGTNDKPYIVMPYPGELPVFDGEWGYGNGNGFCILLCNCSYWHISGLEICKYQETGIFLDDKTHHVEMVKLKIHDVTDYITPHSSFGRSGITSSADDCILDNCEIYDIGYNRDIGDMHDHGIYMCSKGSGWIIQNNSFRNLPAGGGVHIYGGSGDKSRNIIENNRFENTHLGIVLGGEECCNNDVHHNTFKHNTKCDMFMTEGAHDNYIHHNIFGSMLHDPIEGNNAHIDFAQLCCLYNSFDWNSYYDFESNGAIYPARIENWVGGNTFHQMVTWDVWTAEAEAVHYEYVYDGSASRISGLGMEKNGMIITDVKYNAHNN